MILVVPGIILAMTQFWTQQVGSNKENARTLLNLDGSNGPTHPWSRGHLGFDFEVHD